MNAPRELNKPRPGNKPSELLGHLRSHGAKIWLEDGSKLRLVAPSGLLTETLKQSLAEHKADIISLLENRWSSAVSEPLTSKQEERFEPFPLTDIQRAYWVGRQQAFDFGNVSIHFYTEVDCLRLDLERLERAWNQVVRRHDMLRAIVKDDGEQQILPEVEWYRIGINRLENLSEPETLERLSQVRKRLSHSRRPTDEWPGFGIEISILDEGRARLHVSIDLLHVDGASLHILFDDWSSYYRNQNAVLPRLTLSYRDYVLAELELQNSERYAQDLAYWKKQITQLPPAPALPLAKGADTSEFVRHGFRIDEVSFQRLKKRAGALGITPTMFVLVAFSEIIRHWSKELSFTLNVTLFNRLWVHPEVNQLVGDFTSMILLAVDYQPDESLASKARRLQQRLWEHLDHRTVSGVKVLGELNNYQKARSASIMPVVFTSALDLKGQGFSTDWLDSFGTPSYTLTQTPQVYLDHQVRELKNGGVECTWDVIRGIFFPGMVETMLAAYERLLHDLIGDEAIWEERALSYTPAEQLAQREAINRTQQALGSGQETLVTLFLDQADLRERETAVVHADMVLSYGELRNAAEALGAQLLALGARPDAVVAILMEKGWEQVVAALGIHAASAAYLPIDAEQPEPRIRYFLDNSGAIAVISQPHILANLTLPKGVTAIALDKAWLETNKIRRTAFSPGCEPHQACEPHHLSHVIYTSGSTGSPKGVMVEHRNVVNRVRDINQRYRVGPADKALALTALHHDLSVYDLFGVLAAGGQIVIPEASRRRDPAHWLELLVRHRVTIWNSVPAFLEMLADYQEEHAGRVPSLPDSLRFVILAGDWIPVSLPGRIHRQRPDLQFVASGGPTETTIWDIYYDVGEVDPSWRSIPYGKPLANSQYHILNKLLKPCPTWVPGEMYIGGAGLTRGYLGDEEKTAAKFILHPDTGERLYRSGDMGRYLPDGNIEFLGREDFQVKIRGQRIELAEIEAAVKQYKTVRNALVQVHDGEHGKSLVLYVVPQSHAVTDFDFRFDDADTHTVADEQSDFEQQRVEITDPAERLLFKLEQRGIRRLDNAPTVSLPAIAADANSWRSQREFSQDPIPLERFSGFLGLLGSRQESDSSNGHSKYNYPSGGGLYPVQTYVHVKPGRVEGLAAGLYYYHPRPISFNVFPISRSARSFTTPTTGKRFGPRHSPSI